jgi:hypothetical protein
MEEQAQGELFVKKISFSSIDLLIGLFFFFFSSSLLLFFSSPALRLNLKKTKTKTKKSDVFRKILNSLEDLLTPVTDVKGRRVSISGAVSKDGVDRQMVSTPTALLRNAAITSVNNLSVCMFHVGNIFDAIEMLEMYIKLSPRLFLHPSVVHNLKTCYDVAYKPTRTSSKKVSDFGRYLLHVCH